MHLGPEIRRGLAESNGEGEVAGGIVVMRFGENAYQVIENVKAKLDELKAGLPPGVDIKTEYDRSALIERAVDTLKRKLLEEMIVVALIIIVFLLHFRSSLVAIFVMPTGVLASIILMNAIGLNANIMWLGGIALAIGVMVDTAVIMVENAHKHLEHDTGQALARADHHRRRQGSRPAAVLLAADHHRQLPADLQPRRAVRTAVQAAGVHQDVRHGRRGDPVDHDRPGADGSTSSAAASRSEERNPVSRVLMRLYEPLFWHQPARPAV